MDESTNIPTNQKVLEFLKAQPIGVLSTVDSSGNPHATTIYFVVNDDLSIDFFSKRDTQKIKNLSRNNNVVLVSFEARTQTNVQVIGQAQEISNEPVSNEIFKKVLEITRATSQAEVPPVSKLFAGQYVAYRIEPEQIRYSVYQPDPESKAEFETINF